jgi:hypothetical protein
MTMPDRPSIEAALATLDRFMAALNRRDEAALNDALNMDRDAWRGQVGRAGALELRRLVTCAGAE